MKKIWALIMALVMVFSFTACDEGYDSADRIESAPSSTTTLTTEPTEEPTTAPTTQPTVVLTEAPATSSKSPTKAPATVETKAPTKATQEPNPTHSKVPSTFNIHFIDVGQADAALVECDGHYMLIDGGNKADSSIIYSVLQKTGVKKLDIVVGSHAHEDHIGGLPGAFNYTTADITLCPVKDYDTKAFGDFAKYATQKGGGIAIPKVGNTYSLGSATVKILGVNSASDANNSSIVLRIDYGQTSFLFAGDAEREAEQVILNSGVNLKSTVLKVGHHCSDASTTYPFLREIMPQYAVISVGKGNSYGHPREDTLSRLRDADVTVFRTDLQGDIYCTSDGKTINFTVEKNANADVFSGIGDNSTSQNAESPTTNPPTITQEGNSSRDMVWIPNSGKKYHSYSGCSNMKNPSEVTRSEAENRGYTPCKKCW